MKHGCSRRGKRTPEYRSWKMMNNRCNNPATPDFYLYGGRGIIICERWREFAAFLEDMGPRPSPEHSIDRIDNDGHYEPSNCRWADRYVQATNRRNNRNVEFNGETLCLAAWARKTGIHYATIQDRLDSGWGVERALTTPVKRSTGA